MLHKAFETMIAVTPMIALFLFCYGATRDHREDRSVITATSCMAVGLMLLVGWVALILHG